MCKKREQAALQRSAAKVSLFDYQY